MKLFDPHIHMTSRTTMIPLDATLVRGSRGRVFDDHRRPVFITSDPALVNGDPVEATAVKQLILDHVFAR